MMVNLETTLADLVIATPRAARVLYRHRLDFCCGGRRSLADVCAQTGLDADGIVREIDAAHDDGTELHPERLTPVELTDVLVQRYHEPLRAELPRLLELARKVERVHAAKPDCPVGLSAHLVDMESAIALHLDKEEQVLFPMIRAGRSALAHMPVKVMMQEHDDHAVNLRRVHALTRDFALPPDACTSWRNLYDSLQALELELMRHIHIENNILFPAVLAA
jgi:regulator of cell morphogenesis and NO signaling